MTREEIKNKVVAIVADKTCFSVSEIQESTRFKADLGTDSLDNIELLMEFERVFGIKIPDEEMMGVVTVGDVINGLAARFGVVAEDKIKEGWSEEDENYLEEIINDLKFCKKNRQSCKNGLIEDCIDWLNNRLKSVRPQPHWKPSEEQLEALDKVIPVCMVVVGKEEVAPLESLYKDLKKL